MSTHSVDVLKVEEISKHPNADALEIIKAYDYECIVKLGDFKIGDLFLFVHPDSLVDTMRPEFAFLAPKANSEGKVRIRSMKLRGYRSYGLVLKAPKGAKLGDNYWDKLGLEQYEPKLNNAISRMESNVVSGYQVKGPNITVPSPDPENIKKLNNVIPEGEDVMYTAKIHGALFKASYQDGQFFVGSKNTWKMKPGTLAGHQPKSKKEKILNALFSILSFVGGGMFGLCLLVILSMTSLVSVVLVTILFAICVFGISKLQKILLSMQQDRRIFAPVNSWWAGFEQNPWLGVWLKSNPNTIVFGEIYGPGVQGDKFHYGKEVGQYGIAIFDVYESGKFVDQIDLHHQERYTDLQKVPLLHQGLHDKALMKSLAELPESFNGCNHIREGLVVKPLTERRDGRMGRVVLKYISDQYLERS